MSKRSLLSSAVVAGLVVTSLLTFGAAAWAKPILMPTMQQVIQSQRAAYEASGHSVQPPAPPCPQANQLPAPLGQCGPPQPPALTQPYPGNMAYWGGHVQVQPHIYIVYFGWGENGAFPASKPCHPVHLSEGSIRATLKCDPDGAGARMADFVHELGGTAWAGLQSQYYQTVTDPAGQTYQQYITNPANQLSGIWVDDSNRTSAKITYTDMAKEAARAVAHFHVTDLSNANFVIAQPEKFSDPQALASGYCAFHDYTVPNLFGGIYNGIQQGISYTNMPYILDIDSGGANVCGTNAVNSGKAGTLDGISIVLGHEIEETVTDPGAGDILGSGTNTTNLGAWYDAVDPNENGDKCAWVGEPLIGGIPGAPNVIPEPGALNNITGNQGTKFAVQSLWSNNAAEGAGYCAGAGNDLPQPVPPA